MAENDLHVNKLKDENASVAREFVLKNFIGQVVHVRAMKQVEQTEKCDPRFTTSNDDAIPLLTFEEITDDIKFAFAGNFVCWTGNQCVHVLDTSTKERKMISLP